MKNVFAWLQLVRFPNVFVILADILTVGFILTVLQVLPGQNLCPFIVAGVGSVLLYWSGMVLNDVFDVEEDQFLRSDRPIPSGRISLKRASCTGYSLLASGWLLCVLAGIGTGTPQTACLVGGIAILLASSIFMYDARLKNTLLGPFLMGLCRGLNVLLFMAFISWDEIVSRGGAFPLLLYPIALIIFIAGVTFYARYETEEAPETGIRRPGIGVLLLSLICLGIGPMLLLEFPRLMNTVFPGSVIPLFTFQTWRWPSLLVILTLWLVFRALTAIFQGPLAVRRAVKQALFLVFLLDAGLTLIVAGTAFALVILSLFCIASVLGRWIYST